MDRLQYEPGDTVHVSVALSPLLGKREIVDVALPIPEFITPGRLILQIVNEREQQLQDIKRTAYQPKTLGELIGLIEKSGRNDVLVARFIASRPSVTMGGREISGLPTSVLSALSLARGSDVVQKSQQSVYGQKQVMTNYVLTGSQTALLVVGKDGSATFSSRRSSGEEKR